MKRQEILEIIVSNPQAIFKNYNRQMSKYSEFPTYFQVVNTGDDKSSVFIKSVTVRTVDYLKDDKGGFIRDENGVIPDTRPIADRTEVQYGGTRLMPTRLILKTDITEASMLADHIAEEEANEKERQARDNATAQADTEAMELAEVFTSLGITNMNTNYEGKISLSSWGRITLQFEGESITRLVSALKSALVEGES
jgi:hypothetical protein